MTLGLTDARAAEIRRTAGPNAVRSHRTSPFTVLIRQLRSPLLVLLIVAAGVSAVVGERTDAIVITVIVTMSVGLGFFNEYRAERAVNALHERLRHRALVHRDGRLVSRDVADLVPGDVVELRPGTVVPADLRLTAARAIECDESVLSGESLPVVKGAGDTALMGTVVASGIATGEVAATGAHTAFGRIATGLGERQQQTAFQVGLGRFSMLLVRVAAVLTAGIFVVNLLLHRPFLDALLFSLAIAVGITPQLLPAVVTTSLATGARRLTRLKVLVKRLVAIEDLGDIEVLFTDKTGTLTQADITLREAVPAGDGAGDMTLLYGLLCTGIGRAEAADPLDAALWRAPAARALPADEYRRLDDLPFDHERRMASVLVEGPDGTRSIITKGAPEAVFGRCADVPGTARAVAEKRFAEGGRVIAVATRPAGDAGTLTRADEKDLRLSGLLVFVDPPKPDAADALARLAAAGVTVKIVTGDNPLVARKVCADLGLGTGEVLTGEDVDRLDDDDLRRAIPRTTVFARIGPEQKARIVRAQRAHGLDVAFLGDGVNDALALHAADVGISVDSATDVAKDAADVVLLEKNLGVLADGIVEGRRIFANTMKYVLMSTASNVGNMFSAAAASALLPFLPMLPGQILLNNLLYDTSQLAIPTDAVDEEQLVRPARFDLKLIRRFMLVFGPLSSVFDLTMFWLLRGVFHAGPPLFRASWFVESLATQTLVIFLVRTRRSPFWRSRPGVVVASAALAVVAAGAALPFTPFAADLGFSRVTGAILAVTAGIVVAYLALVELIKTRFYRGRPAPAPGRGPDRHRGLHRRAAPFSVPAPLRRPGRRPPRRPAPSTGPGSAGTR
ncbi:magnesium-translocating P-type ATPase [Actinoallomurus spadix]|uniref:Magnesium-transporting ATPase, P-type 1 n=1 Tax=Actinoallomurus spadix TaxID=79912 RepID=A0ABP3FIH8_9ACTN|nr:magnesium-translocating P-type ATPase [Actinoallomurus spadix]MCO5991548.1 magnesium-translocating P-type ATPase [Actinoallomurus spadix]